MTARPGSGRLARTMMVKVKICGITSAADALMCIRAGADALGFNFWRQSKRHVTPDAAKAIRSSLPPFVATVGLFVDADPEDVMRVMAHCDLDCAQLCGDESPYVVSKLHGFQIVKSIRVRGEGDLRAIDRYRIDGFLLDAYVPGQLGGTGATFDWALARQASSRTNVILAGGLTPENVAEAIGAARPYAVDVASGVEEAPGRKSRKLVTEFIRAAKSVDL